MKKKSICSLVMVVVIVLLVWLLFKREGFATEADIPSIKSTLGSFLTFPEMEVAISTLMSGNPPSNTTPVTISFDSKIRDPNNNVGTVWKELLNKYVFGVSDSTGKLY